ncbi:MAG: galactokinase [Treponema sp.]|nr:MAG: galactokinase [Treponema sp.]
MKKIIPYHIDEYGDEPEVTVAVPGRFHLLGEHLWFAHGDTLSLAIDKSLYICVSKRSDNNFRFLSLSLEERKRVTLAGLRYRKEDRWANSIKAVILAFIDHGIHISGLNFTILSEIPADAGLGTPNALKVATGLALRKIFAPNLSKHDLADIIEYANIQHLNTYAHRADIYSVLFAKAGKCVHTRHTKKIADICDIPLDGYSIVLTDSRIPRSIAREELNARVDECIEAYQLVKDLPDAPKQMSDITETFLDEIDIPEAVRRRVAYIIRESASINTAVNALQRNELQMFTRLIHRSHEGLRDRFEISSPELDWLVKRACEFNEPDTNSLVCSRLTGKGFGGCTYAILKTETVEEYQNKMIDYERIFGFTPIQHKVKPAGAARIL